MLAIVLSKYLSHINMFPLPEKKNVFPPYLLLNR